MEFHRLVSTNEASFLRLPLELRRNIYAYILPHTEAFDLRFQRGNGEVKHQSESNKEGSEIVWRLGCISILSTCRHIHDECVDMIYGDNTFVIDVSFDAIEFNQRWRTANNLTPGRPYLFLDHFSQRNLMKIRNYVVNVEHVDDYTGMIKFNYSGQGLTAGIRAKVQELVDLLVLAPNLRRLHVHLTDGAISRLRFPSARVHRVQDVKNDFASQTVLNPFMGVSGVCKVTVTGVSETYATRLKTSMAETRGAPRG